MVRHGKCCPEDLWLPHPRKCSKPGWIRLGVTWSRGRCSCPWQGATRCSVRSFQLKLSHYRMRETRGCNSDCCCRVILATLFMECHGNLCHMQWTPENHHHHKKQERVELHPHFSIWFIVVSFFATQATRLSKPMCQWPQRWTKSLAVPPWIPAPRDCCLVSQHTVIRASVFRKNCSIFREIIFTEAT